jgi:hypothetical protein
LKELYKQAESQEGFDNNGDIPRVSLSRFISHDNGKKEVMAGLDSFNVVLFDSDTKKVFRDEKASRYPFELIFKGAHKPMFVFE